MDFDKDWKKKVGFPINYNSGQSSDDDIVDVVMRRPRKSEVLLADGGDGAEADLLGTTPPRERIRFKQKRKMYLESAMGRGGEARRAVDDMVLSQPISPGTERLKKRLSVKMMRSKERDWKQDLSLRDSKADSLPSPNPIPTGPTVVESCNRFMSLTSKLKCREACPEFSESSSLRDELPPSRVDFHNTFSLLINMGNVDKGCRRTISREEQVWQNELKDLIWLELQAKLAGRSLAQQDAFLCKQRLIVPTVIHNIRNYCFVNPNPCRASSRRPCVIDGSREDLTEQSEESDCKEADDGNAGAVLDCLAFNCQQCSDAIGKALREVGTLLDSLFNAIALYPSTKAMTLEYPLVATLLFQNRVKAMCLWYNTAMHMRLKVIAVRRMLRSVRRGRSAFKQLPSVDSDVSRQSTDKPCQVRFNVSNTPTDSNNSESSVQSEGKEEVRGEEKEKEGEKEQGDEVDCASKSYSSEQAEPTTPEIIISADNNGTADTVGSNESGYSTSADVAERRELELEHEHVFDVGSLHELTKLRVLDKCAVSPYRSYHHEMLKTQGVRRCMVFMNKIRRNLLSKVFLTLEKPISIKPQTIPEEEQDPAEVFDDTKEEEEKGDEEDQDASNYELRRIHFGECATALHELIPPSPFHLRGTRRRLGFHPYVVDLPAIRTKKFASSFIMRTAKVWNSLPADLFPEQYNLGLFKARVNRHFSRYGCWSEESLAMRLPSYRNHFLLLSTVCMEAVHDYLSLRLEDRPENPSCLTVKQLIHDLKEGLDIATEMRAAFVRNIEVALAGHRAGSRARHDLLLIIRTFDATIETVLKQYLSYVVKMSATEHMSRASLQAEWSFTARLAKRITCAKLNAPRTFTRARIPRHDLPPCWFVLAFFETTTTIVLAFFDTMAPSAMEIERNETKMAGCRRAPAAGVRPAACLLDYPLGALLYIRPQPEVMYVALNYYRLGISEIACNQLNRLNEQYDEKLRQVNELSKHTSVPTLQMVYAMCRSAQAIYSSEREATLQAAQWARALAARLACRKQYNALRADIFNSLMALRDCVVKHTLLILERSRIPPSENYVDMEAASARVRELLLQVYKVGFELHKELYKLAQAPFAQELLRSRRRPASLQPPRPAPLPRAPAGRRRPDTVLIHESLNPALHKELQRLVTERFPATTRRSISHPRRLLRADSIGEDVDYNAFDDRLLDNYATDGQTQTQTSIELLLSGQGQGQGQGQRQQEVEHRGEAESAALLSEEERRWAVLVARAVVQFARCWMTFVVERCDTGRGRRPRWASQGLEFLMLACDPCNTKHLSDEEFEELKKEMDGCISHVIGSRPAAAARAQDNIVMSPCSTRRRKISGPLSTSREPRETPPPPSPPTDPDPDPLLAFTPTEPAAHRTRVLEAIKQLDCCRDEKLREMRTVGHVLEAAVASYEPKLRQLKFKWQRGLKIGAGTFGKVYTVVNTESGQLLAMKEISVGAGDRRAMQRAANELRVLEGAAHPHLVRYYGCELHREEMLIFMELCVEGSLEALVATSGALAEHTVRRYSKQLVSAVAELHARSIAHRDIKSGNIFLTNEGHCLKLGDFGSAAKIRANTTAAGELQGYVGTQAYMAPEVFMKSTGHGRAADVWSLGCVVTEMATGKRPFSEYDSNYQIMFVVGMGGRPTIPETLSEEGQQFCLSCLTHEPELRPKAEALSLHHFLMVKSDEDCNCEPAYLIASPTY